MKRRSFLQLLGLVPVAAALPTVAEGSAWYELGDVLDWLPSPPPVSDPRLNEIITTTLGNRAGTLADNITQNNELLARLKAKGQVRELYGPPEYYPDDDEDY
jgi:hypothetical protein